MLDTDDELAALQALASELAAEAGERAKPLGAVDVDESARVGPCTSPTILFLQSLV